MKGELLEINKNFIRNCFDCIFRDGKNCDIKDDELTLEDVNGSILQFADAKYCEHHAPRELNAEIEY